MRASAHRSQARPYWHTGHSTVHVRCATGHPGGPRRQCSNGRIPTALVTWLAHRTCPVYTGLSGVPAEQRLLRANGHLQRHLMCARSAQKSGTREVAHRTLYSACPVCHRTSRRAQQSELQRSEPNGLVTWLAHRTLSGVHRTVRCTMRQTASTKRLVWWLGL